MSNGAENEAYSLCPSFTLPSSNSLLFPDNFYNTHFSGCFSYFSI